MTGGLFDPLGTDRDAPERARRAARSSRSAAAPAVVVGLLLAGLAGLLVASYLRDDGDRGSPVAVAPIEHLPPPAPIPPAAPAPAPVPAAASTAAVPATQPVPPPPALAAPPAAQPTVQPSAAFGLPAPRADQDVQIENGVRVVRPRREAPSPVSPQGGQMLRVPEAAPTKAAR